MWRLATPADDESVVSMCLSLNADDPAPNPVQPQQIRRTLSELRHRPERGRAVVCELAGQAIGYALLISFWSNELGGEVCIIDELFVASEYRSRGLATDLFDALADAPQLLWPSRPAALALEVSVDNRRARALYERLGFGGDNLSMRRVLPPERASLRS